MTTCQYLDLKFILEKYLLPSSVSIVSLTKRILYAYLIALLISFLKSILNLSEQSDFLAKTTLLHYGLLDFLKA